MAGASLPEGRHRMTFPQSAKGSRRSPLHSTPVRRSVLPREVQNAERTVTDGAAALARLRHAALLGGVTLRGNRVPPFARLGSFALEALALAGVAPTYAVNRWVERARSDERKQEKELAMTTSEIPALVQPAAVQAYADAEQFGKVLQRNWEGGLLVARSVELRKGQGERTDLGEISPRLGKVSARQYAEWAKVDHKTVLAYLRAWDAAAEDGLVPAAEDLRPGDDAVLPEQAWDDMTARSASGMIRRHRP